MARKSLKMKRRLSSLWTSLKSPFKRRNNTANFLGNFDFIDTNLRQTFNESFLAEEIMDSDPSADPLPADPEPPTMDTLIDDCLVPILAYLPLTEQITNIPLTCSRWNNLLPRVHQQRTQLVLRNTDRCPPESGLARRLFNHPPPEEALPYTDYLTHLFNDADRAQMTTLNPDFAFQNKRLSATFCKQLGVSFPNLRHLSLVYARIRPDTLSYLLAHFRVKLRSISLFSSLLFYAYETHEDVLVSLQKILAVINSMASLTRLALQNFPSHGLPHPDLATELATVLPNLIEFHLVEHENNVLPILERLDENKLRRLNLRGTVWPDEGMFSRLVATKPALGQNLTHLTIYTFMFTAEGDPEDFDLLHLKRTVKAFPQLAHLEIYAENSLADMLPHLRKLKHLVSLSLNALDRHFLEESLPNWSPKRLSKFRLDSLRMLTLTQFSFQIEHLSPLSVLFPSLSKLYLDGCKFYCQHEEDYVLLPSERPADCSCKGRLVAQLGNFENLLEMTVNYSVKKVI